MPEEEPTTDPEPAADLGLPMFGDTQPTGITHVLKSAKGSRLGRYLHPGERVVLVVEVLPDDTTLTKKNELKQALSVSDFYPVPDEQATDLLRTARTVYREAHDAARGIEELPFDTSEQPTAYVNQAGVVMTVADIAELTGTPSAADIAASRGVDIDERGDVFTVEFADGTKATWPDDWDGSGQSLAAVGGFMRKPGKKKDTGQVVRYVGADGATLDEWTPDDEGARLERLELELAASEDAAAVAELEAARA